MSSAAKPLAGMRVLVTRASHQSDELSSRLRELGAEPVEIPVLEMKLPEDCRELDASIARSGQYDWIVFASGNAVQFYFARAQSLGFPQSADSGTRYATIGPSTAQLLRSHKKQADYHPDEFIAESFVRQFPGYPSLSGLKFLWPKASVGRMTIAEGLRAAGAHVDVVVCYETDLPQDANVQAEELVRALGDQGVNAVTLASSQTARNVRDLLERVLAREKVTALLADQSAVCIGPQTAAAARTCGFGTVHQAQPYTLDGLVEQLIRLHSQRSLKK